MQDAAAVQRIESKFRALEAVMDERVRRQWAAAEAQAYGWGGIRAVTDATGLSPTTIRKGFAELRRRARRPHDPLPTGIRGGGGGRKQKTESDAGLLTALQALVDPATRGDPQ